MTASLSLASLAGFAMMLGLASAQPPNDSDTAPAALLPGGGVANADGSVGYFPAARPGIDAIDLATGKVLWTTREASRPLATADGRLIAYAPVAKKSNRIRVVVFDGATGKRVLMSQPVVFPDWVGIQVMHGHSFDVGVAVAKDALLLAWQARTWYAGGAPPPQEVIDAARRSASGVQRVDLKTGTVQAVDPASLPKGTVRIAGAPPEKATVGGRTLSVADRRTGNPNNPLEVRRSLQATNGDGQMLWQHEIAAPVRLIPVP